MCGVIFSFFFFLHTGDYNSFNLKEMAMLSVFLFLKFLHQIELSELLLQNSFHFIIWWYQND